MVSFCRRKYHSCSASNCGRPRFDGIRRRVNILDCRKAEIFSLSFWFYSLTVSVVMLGASLGGLTSASYSTFCKVFLSIVISIKIWHFFTSRRQKARIPDCITPSLLGLFRCSFFTNYTPTIVVAVCTSDWSITWYGCRGRGYRRHLQTTRKRRSLGYIFCSMSLSLSQVGFTVGF